MLTLSLISMVLKGSDPRNLKFGRKVTKIWLIIISIIGPCWANCILLEMLQVDDWFVFSALFWLARDDWDTSVSKCKESIGSKKEGESSS
jgi:hypothetical protein